METKELIQYKYRNGVYSIIHLINLVNTQHLSQEDFFDITRLKFSMQQKEFGK